MHTLYPSTKPYITDQSLSLALLCANGNTMNLLTATGSSDHMSTRKVMVI
jgi:hypothetical protein